MFKSLRLWWFVQVAWMGDRKRIRKFLIRKSERKCPPGSQKLYGRFTSFGVLRT